MPDPLRLAAALGVIGVAALAGAQARAARRRTAAAAPLDLSAFSGRLLLFTDAGCRNCERARRVLRAAAVEFEEAAYDGDPDRVRAAGVVGVPLLVGRDASGNEVGRIAGRIGRRSLSRLLARLSL